MPERRLLPETNCGECLYNKTEIVALVNGVCPKCGADYRATMDAFSLPMPKLKKGPHAAKP